MNMHKDGSLADLLKQEEVIIEEDDSNFEEKKDTAADPNEGEGKGDFDYEQSTGGNSKDSKGQSS